MTTYNRCHCSFSHLYIVVIGLDFVNECSEAGFTHGTGCGNLGPLHYAAEAETMCVELRREVK